MPSCASRDRQRAEGPRLPDQQCRRLPQRHQDPPAARLRARPCRRSSWRLSTRPSPSSMDRAEVVATFAPAARAALAAFPVEPDGLELVALAENVTWRVTDRADGASLGAEAAPALVPHAGRAGLRTHCGCGRWPTPGSRCRCRCAPGTARNSPPSSCRRPASGGWPDGALDGGPDHGRRDARGRRSGDRRSVVRAAGRLAARMHEQASRWQPPAGFRRPVLDADGLHGQRAALGPVLGPSCARSRANGGWSSTRVGVSPKCCEG